ncbi:16S rRNA (adenine(1518)-N(6)/adenine(1519)-N(6))-dimethyltransferase RsmA [Fibrobacterota bacterium]
MVFSQEKNRRRAFGQNFLIDQGVVDSLLSDIPCDKQDWIIEIGPGNGALTRGLMGKAGRMTVIEIDPRLVERLRKKKEFSSLHLMQSDAGSIDIDALLREEKDRPLKPVLVGNLPYNKSGPILRHFIPSIKKFQFMYFMVQYEVAKRITALPHNRDFGFLSILVQNHAFVELKQKIPPSAFRPRPKVFSATITLSPKAQPHEDDPMFLPFVRQAFTQKRKKLVNSLQSVCRRSTVLKALNELDLPENFRPEDLSVKNFAALYRILKKDLGMHL